VTGRLSGTVGLHTTKALDILQMRLREASWAGNGRKESETFHSAVRRMDSRRIEIQRTGRWTVS